MKNNTIITIFTPTYNRAKCLERCYRSLLKQTNRNFVWLIIDDGSTDSTEDLVAQWLDSNKVRIKYIKQKNSGKHIAHNVAVSNCETEYMLILDSDDILSETSVGILICHIGNIQGLESISGIIGNRYKMSDKQCLGRIMPANITYASGIELRQLHGINGDTLRLYKTSILKQYLFPVIKGEKFVYENVVFDAIDAKYKMYIINEKLYFSEYLLDGYTSNSKKVKIDNPIGYSLSLNSAVKHSISIKKRVNWTLLYIIWCSTLNLKQAYSNFNNKTLYITLYPFSIFLRYIRKPKFFYEIFDLYGIKK